MKKLLTLILSVLLLTCSAVCFTACNNEKIVTVGYTIYDPMNYIDDNNKLVGFDTELAEKVFGNLGYKVMFKEIDWDNKYLELNNGTIDCVWNGFTMNSTDQDSEGKVVARNTLCDFSIEYMVNGQCLFAKIANNISDIADLNGKTLAYEGGSAAASLITAEDSMFKNTGFIDSALPYQKDAAEQVMNGNKDYAVIDAIFAKSLIENNPSYSDCVICDIDLGSEVYAIGFKKGSELTAKVNAEIKKLAENGELQALAEKYGVADTLISSWN